MDHLNPRAPLATYEVSNQAGLFEAVNLLGADAMLKSARGWSGAGRYANRLSEFGAR